MKKEKDNRKEFKIKFKINEDKTVSFTDPCCDTIPAVLFGQLITSIAIVEREYNKRIKERGTSRG